MTKTDTGGPAFPTPGTAYTSPTNGMTLRDYFAAKAMQGLLASNVEAPIERFAEKSYAMADAMLREKNND